MLQREDTNGLHKSPHLRILIVSGWQTGWAKANQGNQGGNFKLYMNSAIVPKWIINTQSKRENYAHTFFFFTVWQTPIYPLKPTVDTPTVEPAPIPQIELISIEERCTGII